MHKYDAIQAFRAGNNAGRGYGRTEDTIAQTIEALTEAGGELLCSRDCDADVAVVDMGNHWTLIGGDSLGEYPWCVDVGK
jgi:phosphomannomutase